MPGWRAWLVIGGLAFAGTLVAAWQYVPGFQEAVRVVWGDVRARVE